MVPVLPLVIISRIQLQIPIAYYKAMLRDHIEAEEKKKKKKKQCSVASDEEEEEEMTV